MLQSHKPLLENTPVSLQLKSLIAKQIGQIFQQCQFGYSDS